MECEMRINPVINYNIFKGNCTITKQSKVTSGEEDIKLIKNTINTIKKYSGPIYFDEGFEYNPFCEFSFDYKLPEITSIRFDNSYSRSRPGVLSISSALGRSVKKTEITANTKNKDTLQELIDVLSEVKPYNCMLVDKQRIENIMQLGSCEMMELPLPF